ncbi:13489_t:CDS:1, partial [Rhizophagus irregularis]
HPTKCPEFPLSPPITWMGSSIHSPLPSTFFLNFLTILVPIWQKWMLR